MAFIISGSKDKYYFLNYTKQYIYFLLCSKTLFFNIINIIHHTISHLNLIIYTTIYNVQELSRLLFFPFSKGLLFHSIPYFRHLVKEKQSLRQKINRIKLFIPNNFLYFCPLKSKDYSMRKKILVLDDKIAIAKVLQSICQ